MSLLDAIDRLRQYANTHGEAADRATLERLDEELRTRHALARQRGLLADLPTRPEHADAPRVTGPVEKVLRLEHSNLRVVVVTQRALHVRYPLFVIDRLVPLDAPVLLVRPTSRWGREMDLLRRLAVEHEQATAPPPDYVTLDIIAIYLRRSKRTLERLKEREPNPLPSPDIEGGGGRADEWLWATLRPWLQEEFGRQLPERFPSWRPGT
jgi:hypothetical protein